LQFDALGFFGGNQAVSMPGISQTKIQQQWENTKIKLEVLKRISEKIHF